MTHLITSLEQDAYALMLDSGKTILERIETTHSSKHLFKLFQAIIRKNHADFTRTCKTGIKASRKDMPHDKEGLYWYVQTEEKLRQALLEQELTKAFGYDKRVPFSLTKQEIFYSDVEKMEVGYYWLQLLLHIVTKNNPDKGKEEEEWKNALTHYHEGKSLPKEIPLEAQSVFASRTQFCQQYKGHKIEEASTFSECFVSMAIHTIRMDQRRLAGELLTKRDDEIKSTLESFDKEQQRALFELVFCELYSLLSNRTEQVDLRKPKFGSSTALQNSLMMNKLKEKILVLQVAKIQQLFASKIEEVNPPSDMIAELFDQARTEDWIQTTHLEDRIDEIKRKCIGRINALQTTDSDEIAKCILYESQHTTVLEHFPETLITNLRKQKRFLQIFTSLLPLVLKDKKELENSDADAPLETTATRSRKVSGRGHARRISGAFKKLVSPRKDRGLPVDPSPSVSELTSSPEKGPTHVLRRLESSSRGGRELNEIKRELTSLRDLMDCLIAIQQIGR